MVGSSSAAEETEQSEQPAIEPAAAAVEEQQQQQADSMPPPPPTQPIHLRTSTILDLANDNDDAQVDYTETDRALEEQLSATRNNNRNKHENDDHDENDDEEMQDDKEDVTEEKKILLGAGGATGGAAVLLEPSQMMKENENKQTATPSTQPGATRVRGPEYDLERHGENDGDNVRVVEEDLSDEPNIKSAEFRGSAATTTATSNTEDGTMPVIHAEKVDEDDLENQIRQKIASEAVEAEVHGSMGSLRRKKKLVCIGVLVLLVVIVGLVVGLVVARRDSSNPQENQTAPPSMLPSMSPSNVPSQSPSFSQEALDILELLKESSPDGGQALENTTSAQYQAFLWTIDGEESPDPSRLVQRYAMVTLYYATGGDDWSNKDGWLTEEDECTWWSQREGTMCDLSGNVWYLDLHSNNLIGSIPREISLLRGLREFVLASNTLVGSIPRDDMATMFALRVIDLSSNQLTGPLPVVTDSDLFVQLENKSFALVTELRLSSNQINSTLPPELGTLSSLIALDLSSNFIHGQVPESLDKLTRLQELDLFEMFLSGTVPESVWAAIEDMKTLNLYNSGLGGTIPAAIGNLKSLQVLDISSYTRNAGGSKNNFHGSFPDEFREASQLHTLKFEDNAINQSLPDLLSLLPDTLEVLSGRGNQLHSELSPALGNFTKLRYLDVQGNKLEGPIPKEVGQLTNVIEFKIGSNQLTGPFVSEFGNLTKLTRLFIQSNRLSGQIPSEIGYMTQLSSLVLHTNDFNGTLPTQFGKLDLGMIQLQLLWGITGPLPTEFGRLTNMFRVRITETSMTGSFPTELGNLKKVKQFKVQHNQFSGNLPDDLGNMTSITEFSVFNNTFNGTIPQSLAGLDFITQASFALNNFVGDMPFCNGNSTDLEIVVADCDEVVCECCSSCCVDGEVCTAPEVAGRAAS